MIILGMSMSSDATATLLKDGEIVVAIGEERLSRVKNHIGVPWAAAEFCLKEAGVAWKDIDIVASGFERYVRITDSVDIDVLMASKSDVDFSNEKPAWYRWRKAADTILAGIRKVVGASRSRTLGDVLQAELARRGFGGKFVCVEHHTAHAYSALCNCRRPRTIVITADGYGDGLSGAISVYDGQQLRRLHSVSDDNSLGIFYSAVTKFLGFMSHRHEGKVTGLAGYGDPTVHQAYFDSLFRYDPATSDFKFKFKKNSNRYIVAAGFVFNLMVGRKYLPGLYFNELVEDFGKNLDSKDLANVAAGAQWKFEKETLAWLDHQLTTQRAAIGADVTTCGIHLAGGNFSNVSLNFRVFDHFKPASFYVHPNMGDGGTALGAALYCHHTIEKNGMTWTGANHEHVFLAPMTDDPVRDSQMRPLLISELGTPMDVAKLVAAGKIVGRVYGGMEYGPRALGHRTILFQPYDRSANDYVNKRLKRNEFMPFAPILTEESATKYLDFDPRLADAMYYMTVACRLKPAVSNRLGAICHVDGTARPQFVSTKLDSQMHEILTCFEQITGDSICVNTSFNAHEEPIVSTLQNAFARLIDGSVDVVFDGTNLWRKAPVPA